MRIDAYPKGKYMIIRFQDEHSDISDLSELQDLITGYLERDKIHIAVNFCNASYIYSGAIRVLVNCHRMITNKGGSLSILEPDPSLFDILETLNIDRVINIYVSDEFLPV
jgi:anti-anti-sigma factor